jgi:hypothetical protein
MNGLLQAGITAQELLAKKLKEHGFTQRKIMPGLWTHEWCPITFSLVVDNFGIKYIGEEHAQHLLQMVQKYYTGLKRRGKDIADSPSSGIMLTRKCTFQCHHMLRRHKSTFSILHILYRRINRISTSKSCMVTKIQKANPLNTSPPLDKAGKKFIQEVTGIFLYLAQAVDSTMLTTLSSLVSKQATPTERTMLKCLQILDYAASQEDAIVTY